MAVEAEDWRLSVNAWGEWAEDATDAESGQRRGAGGWLPQGLGAPSPLIENAPAPSLGYMEQPGRSFLDMLAESIGNAPAPQRPRNFGEGLMAGAAKGFARTRGKDMDEREKLQASMKERQAAQNARAIKANDDASARTMDEAEGVRKSKRAEVAALYKGAEDLRLTKPNDQQNPRNAARFQSLNERVYQMYRAKADIASKRLGSSDPSLLAALDAKEAIIDRDLAPAMEQRAALMVDLPKPAGGGFTPSQNAQNMRALNSAIRQDPDIKDFVTVRDNYKRIEQAAKSGSGVGDLSLIFAYMKVLDPTSVVRESEYNNAQAAIGKLPQLANIPQNFLNGQKLTPAGRQYFLRATKDLYIAKREDHRRAVDMYRLQAQEYGIDPKLVLRDYEAAGATTPRAPRDLSPDGIPVYDSPKKGP